MINKLTLCLIFLLSCSLQAQESTIVKVFKPNEVSIEVDNTKGVPKEMDGLAWNRWTSKNFVVCSLNDIQAQYLHKHLELVKVWTFYRWGMYDVDLSVPCKLICVDDKSLFKKLFNLEQTKVEVRLASDGKIKETVIFLLIDGLPSETIPVPLTEVCLAECAQKYHTKFNLWMIKGMSNLNGEIKQIRRQISEVKQLLDADKPLPFSQNLLEMTESQYQKLSIDKRKNFDNCAVMFCLMIYKEFGQDKYLKFVYDSTRMSPEKALEQNIGFKTYAEFDKSFKRFMVDLTNDVVIGKTPDSYLQITEK